MPAGIAMCRCTGCGSVAFPPRALCPRCGGDRWETVIALAGTVGEVTWRRRGDRARGEASLQLASVSSDIGPVVTVVAPDDDMEPGMRVALESEPDASIDPEGCQLRARSVARGIGSSDLVCGL